MVFRSRRKVIFVHGCYWHRHSCKYGLSMPTTNRAFWKNKFESNIRRDHRVRKELESKGWKALVLWECKIKSFGIPSLKSEIEQFLLD